MHEDTLNLEIRKFLKAIGITSQRAIEMAVREAAAKDTLAGRNRIAATMTLIAPEIGPTIKWRLRSSSAEVGPSRPGIYGCRVG